MWRLSKVDFERENDLDSYLTYPLKEIEIGMA